MKTREYIHALSLWRLMNTPGIDIEPLTHMLDKASGTGEWYVVDHDYQRKDDKVGRFYSHGSLITQKRMYRHFLTQGTYVEFDITASNPTILAMFMREMGEPCLALEDYLKYRNEYHTEFEDNAPDYVWGLQLGDDPVSVKLLVNAALNSSETACNILSRYAQTDRWYHLMADIARAREYVWKNTSTPYDRCSRRPAASKLANFLLTREANLIHGLMTYIHPLGIPYCDKDDRFGCGYAYDGIFVQKKHLIDKHGDELMGWVNEYMREKIGILYDPNKECPHGDDDMIRPRLKIKEMETAPSFEPIAFDDEQSRVCDLQELMPFKKLLIRAATGEGKTHQSLKFATENFGQILIIVHRRFLAKDIAKKHREFVSYIDEDDNMKNLDSGRLIVCLNSLDKIPDMKRFECVIIDELSSVLAQMISMRLGKVTVQILETILRKEDLTVIGMDALLCDQDVAFMQTIADYQFYTPGAVRQPEKKCTILNSKNQWKSKLAAAISDGKRVCIPYSTSIDAMQGILEHLDVSYANVNRYTKKDYEVADFTDYRVVAFTPTIDAGVDITFFDRDGDRYPYFDVVFGLFNRRNTSPKQAVQMLGRVRDCSEYYACFTGSSDAQIFESEVCFERYLRGRVHFIEYYNLDTTISDDFELFVSKNFRYRLTWNYMKHRMESIRTNYSRYFKRYLVMNRWMVYTDDPQLTPREIQLIQDMAQRERMAKLEAIRAVAEARVLTDAEAALLEQKDLDTEEHNQLKAYKITKAFGMDMNRPAWVGASLDHDTEEYREGLRVEQAQVLYAYTEDGEPDGFDYVSYYDEARLIYIRSKQLMDTFKDKVMSVPFYFHRHSFMEMTWVIATILKMLGFDQLYQRIDTIHYDKVRESGALKQYFKKRTIDEFLLAEAGLFIKEVDESQYELRTRHISPDYRTENAFYIESFPIIYESEAPEGFTFIGKRIKCQTCFKTMNRSYAHRHRCRALPEGCVYRENVSTGGSYVVCIRCDPNQRLNANYKRHAAFHERQ